ncbi:MAG TPA: alpha/beta hydrolase [Xanthobacteraceae bacterium]|jgi:esterase/lipase superfamily enzyme|nr:alpha/beta hydrolase [Xanthobacteraceae bacterium]
MLPDRTAVSRRTALRGLASAATALAVAGCAGLAATGVRFDASALVNNPTLLVATTRKPVGGARAKPWFGTERSRKITLARAALTPPDDGRFSLSAIGLSDWSIASIEPVAQIDDLLGHATSPRDLLVYIHGFNQTFEVAALDAARLSDGIKFAGYTMAFSWPSRASLLDYNWDRESAMYSRDALDQVLEDLLAHPAVGRVNIVAHSVGTMLTMEALRQLYAKLGDYSADRIGAVVFASPDIDMDVFTASVQRIGPLAPKVTIITATDDRALAVSRWVNGSTTRVGAAEKAQLEKLGLRVIDASSQGWGILNHDRFLSNAGVRQAIHDAIGSLPRVGAFAPPGIELGGNLAPPEGAQAATRADAN